MNLLPARVSVNALYDFTSLFVPKGTPSRSRIELRIKVPDVNLSVRDFGAYLSLVDRVYGRVTQAGLRSYAKTPYRHLRITEIRRGSVELIVEQVISHYTESVPLVILWLFLKHLPNFIKSFSEAAKNAADSYKNIEDAKLARENRRHLREEIKRDEVLAKLDPNRLKQLVLLLEGLQAAESERLPGPIKFARNEVELIALVIVDKEEIRKA